MFLNVVIGKPLIDPKCLLALDDSDWQNNEQLQTLFTETRYLPAVMKEAGVVFNLQAKCGKIVQT